MNTSLETILLHAPFETSLCINCQRIRSKHSFRSTALNCRSHHFKLPTQTTKSHFDLQILVSDKNFITKIISISCNSPPPLSPSPFKHELSNQAADHNSGILEKHGCDLSRLIAAHPNTEISPGSEFRNPSVLQPLLKNHHLWDYIQDSLCHGVKKNSQKLRRHPGKRIYRPL